MQDVVFERFEASINDLGLSIDHIDEDDLIHIKHGESSIQISLDNVIDCS